MSRVYAFKCKKCGRRELWPWYDTDFICGRVNDSEGPCGGEMVRDYKAEAVGIHTENLKAARQ